MGGRVRTQLNITVNHSENYTDPTTSAATAIKVTWRKAHGLSTQPNFKIRR